MNTSVKLPLIVEKGKRIKQVRRIKNSYQITSGFVKLFFSEAIIAKKKEGLIMLKYVVQCSASAGKKYLSQEERMIYTPSKFFMGDSYYPMFYKAKWFDSVAEAKNFMRLIPRELDYWRKESKWQIVPLDITWKEVIKFDDYGEEIHTGKFYPTWEEKPVVEEF